MSDQSRLGSLFEAFVNVVIGFGINFCMNLLILPVFFGHSISLTANFVMGLVFTVVSVARSYAIRRWFNGRLRAFVNRVFPSNKAPQCPQSPTRRSLCLRWTSTFRNAPSSMRYVIGRWFRVVKTGRNSRWLNGSP